MGLPSERLPAEAAQLGHAWLQATHGSYSLSTGLRFDGKVTRSRQKFSDDERSVLQRAIAAGQRHELRWLCSHMKTLITKPCTCCAVL